MMKFLVLFSIFTALSAQGSITDIVNEVEVEEHVEHMRKKGFTLSNIKDNYASDGRRPRCICDSYTFSYSKFVVRNNAARIQEKTFDVSSTGFGVAKKISVNEVR